MTPLVTNATTKAGPFAEAAFVEPPDPNPEVDPLDNAVVVILDPIPNGFGSALDTILPGS